MEVMADAVRLLLLTGCRKSEILTLECARVDWRKSCLRLPDSKTGAKVVPPADRALAILKRRWDPGRPEPTCAVTTPVNGPNPLSALLAVAVSHPAPSTITLRPQRRR
jgi:integrase